LTWLHKEVGLIEKFSATVKSSSKKPKKPNRSTVHITN